MRIRSLKKWCFFQLWQSGLNAFEKRCSCWKNSVRSWRRDIAWSETRCHVWKFYSRITFLLEFLTKMAAGIRNRWFTSSQKWKTDSNRFDAPCLRIPNEGSGKTLDKLFLRVRRIVVFCRSFTISFLRSWN